MYELAHNEDEMIELGRTFAQSLQAGDVVLLTGDLGAGKTTFSKGVIQALTRAGTGDVTSPTYTLVHEFDGKSPVFHLDLYRLDSEAEVIGIGIDDILDDAHIVLVEWGDKFPKLWPPKAIQVQITAEGDSRRLSITRP